jgi:hypothetical protein
MARPARRSVADAPAAGRCRLGVRAGRWRVGGGARLPAVVTFTGNAARSGRRMLLPATARSAVCQRESRLGARSLPSVTGAAWRACVLRGSGFAEAPQDEVRRRHGCLRLFEAPSGRLRMRNGGGWRGWREDALPLPASRSSLPTPGRHPSFLILRGWPIKRLELHVTVKPLIPSDEGIQREAAADPRFRTMAGAPFDRCSSHFWRGEQRQWPSAGSPLPRG